MEEKEETQTVPADETRRKSQMSPAGRTCWESVFIRRRSSGGRPTKTQQKMIEMTELAVDGCFLSYLRASEIKSAFTQFETKMFLPSVFLSRCPVLPSSLMLACRRLTLAWKSRTLAPVWQRHHRLEGVVTSLRLHCWNVKHQKF